MAEHQRYLCVMMHRKICGIDLRKLIPQKEEEELQVDWENLPPFCFDFTKNLSVSYMQAFELDSKIHLAGGVEYYFEDSGPYKRSDKVYELELDITGDNNKEEEPRLNLSKSVPDTPVYFTSQMSFFTEIKGDYYFVMLVGRAPDPTDENFWVLRSGSREWELLPPAPDPEIAGIGAETQWFAFHGRLYLRIALDDGRIFVMYYDAQQRERGMGWTLHHGDDSFTSSFWVTIAGQRRFCTPSVLALSSVPGFGFDCCVAFSCFCLEEEVVIHALLVTRLGVRLIQRIKGCFDGFPAFIRKAGPILIELGEGKFCAVSSGHAKEQDGGDQVLCVVVLSVQVPMEEGFCFDSVGPPTEHDFLVVSVLSKRVYSTKEDLNKWRSFFIFPSIKKEARISPDTEEQRKRKKLSN